MFFVGVDLAWGDRKPTGVAVLDDDGRLVHVAAAGSDEEIVAALTPFTAQACLVAIDAPLVVKNATGNRPAEAALNKDFARFDAGAHPANTSKPEFAVMPRGARVAQALKLDMNPRSRRARRAIEVYPHPATVALFRLGRTLKYKNKPGRDLDSLRSELALLMKHLESLDSAEPRLDLDATRSGWAALVAAVESAQRKSELRVVEDQVDAVVCAYVALFSVRRPQDTVTYGDLDTGYIVTPALPEGLRAEGRGGVRVAGAAGETVSVVEGPTAVEVPTAVDGDWAGDAFAASGGDHSEGRSDPDGADGVVTVAAPVAAAVREYAERREELKRAGAAWIGLVREVLDEAGIDYLTVTGRTKSVASFAAKAARVVDGRPVYPDPLRDITDQLGVRVVTYVLADVDAVARLLADQVVVKDDRDMGRETASQGRFGYASRHLVVGLDEERAARPEHDLLRGRVAAVQIRTVLQHAWAEFEHDIRYKGTVPAEHASEFDRRFTLAAGLLELADREFSAIRERLSGGAVDTSEADDPRIDPRQLAAFLAGQYPDAGWSRTDHYAWISGLLLELGITSLGELSDVLRPVNALDLVARMDYRYPPGAVRRLDDALLAAFGEQYVGLHGNAHRADLLAKRYERLSRPGG